MTSYLKKKDDDIVYYDTDYTDIIKSRKFVHNKSLNKKRHYFHNDKLDVQFDHEYKEIGLNREDWGVTREDYEFAGRQYKINLGGTKLNKIRRAPANAIDRLFEKFDI